MTEQIEVINEPINHISRINEGIMKAFDNVMFQQTKMDNKAYIFIGFSGVILGVINKNGVLNIPLNWILGTFIIILTLSLIPITTKTLTKILECIIKKQITNKHNIFYYNDLYCLNLDEYKEILKKEYKLAYYTTFELNIMEQTLVNSRILRYKVFLHNLSYTILFSSIFIFFIYTIGISIINVMK